MRQPIPFGKYLLLERISVGGMAEVFKAKSFGIEGFEKIIAIKRILPTMAEDADFIRMFIDEAKIAGQLSHANICQIFELGKIGDSHFIAMEFIWGKDLLQITNRFRRMRQHMPAQMAAFIGAKVCEGLDYAHRKKDPAGRPLNIVHRDISPQNVLVSYEGEVKLIDFGIAKAASRSSKTQAGVLKGKFGYMSPEQVRGLPLDRRSDLFAVGTIIYEMLAGDRLFLGESDFSTLEKVRNAEVVPPSELNRNIPPALERIVLKSLARESEDRYQWANELQEDLLAFQMGTEPIFTAKQLAAWMKEAFKAELDKERLLLEQYKKLGRDSLASEDVSEEDEEEEAPRGPGTIALAEGDVEVQGEDDSESTTIGGPDFGGVAAAGLAARPDAAPNPPRPARGRSVQDFGDDGATEIWGEVSSPDPRPASQGPSPAPIAAQPTAILDPARPPSGVVVTFSTPGVGGGAGGGVPAVRPGLGMGANGGAGPISTPPPSPGLPLPMASEPPRPALGAQPLVDVDSILGRGGPGPRPAPAMGPSPGSQPAAGRAITPVSDLRMTAVGQALPPARRRGGFMSDVAIGVALALVVVGLGLGGYWYFVRRRPPAPVVAVAERTGTILVASGDGGAADVYLDGERKGVLSGTDHLKIEGLPPGAYDITVRRQGAVDFTRKVTLAESGTELVMCRFEPVAPGTLRLEIATEGVTILVDNQEISQAAMSEPLALAPGTAHEILAKRDGFEPKATLVTLQPGETQSLRVELAPIGKPSSAGARDAGPLVATNDKPSGDKPSGDKPSGDKPSGDKPSGDRPSGDRPSGGRSPTGPAGRIDLGDGGRKPPDGGTKAPEPVRPPDKPGDTGAAVADVGYLIANTTPWAHVIIDGKDTGKMTPIAPRAKIALKPGRHTVTFAVGDKKFSYPINIEAGKDHRLIKELPVE